MMPNALENPMVIGEYYDDITAKELAALTATDDDYIDFVLAQGDEETVLSHWLGVILSPAAACDLWDGLAEDKLANICRRYVDKHCAQAFEDWL